MRSSFIREPIRQLLETIVDNRGMTVPAADGGIPLIATNCIKETSLYPTFENIRYVSEETHRTWFRAHLQPEDILFVNKGTPGRVCMVPDPVSFCAAQDMIGLRADRSKVYPRYLFAFLRSDWVKEKIRNYHVGLAIPHFKKQDLDAITVPKRSDDEQKAIGDLYFLLSEKIELNNRINAELEGMAKLLYDYWFVQFDFPMTTAQAAALGKPHLTGHPYSASGGKMIYNETLKREIPEGWSDQSISCMIASDKAGDWGEESAIGNYQTEVYCLRGTDINSLNGNGTTTPPKRFILRKNEFKILKPNDLIIEISGGSPTQSTGRASALLKPVFARFDKPLICSNFCKALSLKPDASVFYFYRTWVGLYDAGVFFNWEGKTSGIKNLLFDSFANNHRAVNPDKEITRQFDEILTPFEEIKQANLIQNQELTQLRDWLLPMLMNGQVTVGTNER